MIKPSTNLFFYAVCVSLTGCILLPPPRSQYREIHKFAVSCNETGIVAVLTTNTTALNLPGDAGQTPLHLASLNCCSNVVAVLIAKGANVNAHADARETPLHLAAQEGCDDLIKMLVNAGAELNPHDQKGRTPLKRALESRQTTTAALLRQLGASE